MKKIIITLVLCLLFANTSYAVVDTLWGEQFVEGGISHYGYNNTLQAFSPVGEFMPGDGVDLIHGGENYNREYLSFNLDSLPDTITVISAYLRLYQYDSYGNDSNGIFPNWTGIPGGDTMSCIIDHINYGAALDTMDWTAGDIGDPQTITNCIGPISTTPDTGWKTLNVTSCVQADKAASRNRAQFRMRFEVGSDYDGRGDALYFKSTTTITNKKPCIVIDYLTGIMGDPVDILSINDTKILQNAPNPFCKLTKINYQLIKGGGVTLSVYDLQGRFIKNLVNEHQQPGIYDIVWNGKDNTGRTAGNGVYIYRLESGDFKATKKMVVIK